MVYGINSGYFVLRYDGNIYKPTSLHAADNMLRIGSVGASVPICMFTNVFINFYRLLQRMKT